MVGDVVWSCWTETVVVVGERGDLDFGWVGGGAAEGRGVSDEELDALRFLGRVRFGDWVRGSEGFGFVNGAHVLGESIGAGEGAVAF